MVMTLPIYLLKLEEEKKNDKIKSQENEKYELNQEHVKLCMLDK
jgi:hypothetical protein